MAFGSPYGKQWPLKFWRRAFFRTDIEIFLFLAVTLFISTGVL